VASSTVAARRDLRELEESIRSAEVLLRRCGEASWSGPAAHSYRVVLADLHRRVHRAVSGLDVLDATMTRHLLAVEEAQSRAALAPGALAGPRAPGAGWRR